MPIQKRHQPGAAKTTRKAQARTVQVREQSYTFAYEALAKAAVSSNQISDPYVRYGLYGEASGGGTSLQAIQPVYDFEKLIKVYMESNVLRQCIDSMVVNIESYGYQLEYVGPEGQQDSEEALAEKLKLESFLEGPSPENSMKEIRRLSRIDQEVLGFKVYEVSRDRAGRVVMFDHVPASTVRMTKRDKEATPVSVKIPSAEQPGKYRNRTVYRHFRRFMQVTPNGQKVYFKEFGDPRKIHPLTGEVDDTLSTADEATELLYVGNYVPGNVYGLPRWTGVLPAILGSRESEMVNLNFFRDNAIPAMAVLVSGGALTEESFLKVEQYINAIRGRDAMNRVLVLEAAADETAGSIDHSQPAPKIEMKPMISERQQEGLFQDYDQKNQQKVRSAFRLPPIYVGRAEDYTRASAFASMLTAESQVFLPERQDFDEIMNRKILASFTPRYYRFKSLGPSTAEPEAVSRMIDAFGKEGALTPNAVIKIANRMMDVDIEPVADDWGDYPFAVVMKIIENGGTVKGMTEFIETLGTAASEGDNEEVAPNDDTGQDEDTVSTEQMVRRFVAQEIAKIAGDMKEQAVQTSATPVLEPTE